MRKLEAGDTFRFQCDRDSGNEVVDVRYMGQHVVGDKEIGVAVLGHHLSRSLLIEKRNQGVDTEFCRATAAQLAAGSMPRQGIAFALMKWSR